VLCESRADQNPAFGWRIAPRFVSIVIHPVNPD
jgi:hypothetical protein